MLDPSGTAVTLSGTTSVTATNGNIIVDSTSASSILSSGSPSITAPVLDLSGNIAYSGSNPDKATVTNYGQTSTPDPLRKYPRSQLQRDDGPERFDDHSLGVRDQNLVTRGL